jgi:hypothetical protein
MKSSVIKIVFSLLAMPVLLLAIPFHLSAQDTPAGAWAGTWKFNPEKSKFPGKPPQADQVTIDPDGTISVQETKFGGEEQQLVVQASARQGRPGRRPRRERNGNCDQSESV